MTIKPLLAKAHWEQLSLVEVAEVLGMPQGTVRSRYSRARSRMRDQLGSV